METVTAAGVCSFCLLQPSLTVSQVASVGGSHWPVLLWCRSAASGFPLLTLFAGVCEMCQDTVCCLRPSGWDVAHNIARNKGGSMTLDNLRVSCPACNRFSPAFHKLIFRINMHRYTGTLPFDDERRRREQEMQAAHLLRPVVFESDSSMDCHGPAMMT